VKRKKFQKKIPYQDKQAKMKFSQRNFIPEMEIKSTPKFQWKIKWDVFEAKLVKVPSRGHFIRYLKIRELIALRLASYATILYSGTS
jgi:hypothetical protein